METSKTTQLKESILNMDIEALANVLEENKEYNGLSKSDFIASLERIFDLLKEKNDRFCKSGDGFCMSEFCERSGRKGAYFSSGHSNIELNYVIVEKDGVVDSISTCYNFCVGELTDEIKTSLDRDKQFFSEKIASPEFTLFVENCKKAEEELMEFKNQIINQDIFMPWYEKYKKLKMQFRAYSFYNETASSFVNLHDNIEEIVGYQGCDEQGKKAKQEFDNINWSNNYQLLEWLVKYEELGEGTIFLTLDYAEFEKSYYMDVCGLKISVSSFENMLDFAICFNENYWTQLGEYATTEDDVDENGNIILETLSECLKQRGML